MKEARSKKSLVALSKEEQSKFKIIEGIQIRENVLSAISDDDPELVIQWNSEAFNNVNNSRDGDPTHTIANLVEYIKSAGAKIYTTKTWSLGFKQNAIFLNAFITYQTGKSRRIPSMPDIAKSIKINCNSGEYDIARFDLAFNWP
ncbi:unnamed protein product [Rhizophagus irregularis]|nr:unnamed protein product [Rhizophagus irregularis]